MSVKLVVFNNGLQILGDLVDKDEEKKAVILSKPVQLIMVPGQDGAPKGQVGMAFAPFLQYTTEWETGLSFVVGDILTVGTPQRDLENSYNTAFGSGILLPPGVGRA